MPTLTIEYRDENERLALEQAIAYVPTCVNSPSRPPPGRCWRPARASLWRRAGPCSARPSPPPWAAASPWPSKRGDARALPRGAPRTLQGATPADRPDAPSGRSPLARRYFACPACDQGDFGADRILGVAGYVTRGACRMACLLGVQRSFQKAEVALLEVAGWDLDDNTIRQLCHATAARAGSTREQRDTAEAFARADGDLELHIDAGKVNTRGGWRDVKVAVVARREPGEPITASEWDRPRPAGPFGAFGGGRGGGGRGVRLAVARPRRRGWA